MDINFFYAKHKHRMWMMYLKGYLLDMNEMDEKNISSPNDCELGQWINKYALKAFKDVPELHKLIELHETIHQLVKNIPELKKKGEIKVAMNEIEKLENFSKQLIEIIGKLEEMIPSISATANLKNISKQNA